MHRSPLPHLLALEVVVLAALAFAGWHLVSAGRVPAPASAALRAPGPAQAHDGARRSPEPGGAALSPAVPRPAAPSPANAARLSVDAGFWHQHLGRINQDETTLAGAEWKAIQAAEAFARAYIDGVVLPAVRAAQGGRR